MERVLQPQKIVAVGTAPLKIADQASRLFYRLEGYHEGFRLRADFCRHERHAGITQIFRLEGIQRHLVKHLRGQKITDLRNLRGIVFVDAIQQPAVPDAVRSE